MDKVFIFLTAFTLGVGAGMISVLVQPSLVQVMVSGDQHQVRYNKQNYLLVPCSQTQCK